MGTKENTMHTLPLLLAVAANYLAQIPYYIHQYYIGRHLMPSLPGSFLLLLTLAWFVVGYTLYVRAQRYGRGILLTFLAAQVLFYGHAIVFGFINGSGAAAQLKAHSPFLFVIFLIGYMNFAAAVYYLFRPMKNKNNPMPVEP